MSFELGVVCAKCSRYSPIHTDACVCGHSLLLEARPEAPAKARIDPSATLVDSPAVVAEREAEFKAVKALAPKDREAYQRRISASALAAARPVEAAPTGLFSAPLKRRGSGKTVTSGIGGEIIKPPAGMSLEEWMHQAKNYVCRSCATPVPMGHKFCGRCGAGIPPEIVAARTQFFSQLQSPGRAKLVLLRGEGGEGLTYQLNAESHVVGSRESEHVHIVFPDDRYVSPRHANLFYREGQLVVRDEGSLNGVFLRVRESTDLAFGDIFLAGEQLFRLEPPQPVGDVDDAEGTQFYVSPCPAMRFKVTQLLEGGAAGMTACTRSSSLQIGREGGDLNFPTDLFMSASHCKIEETNGKIALTDLNSRNGTYVRLRSDRELVHGDYIFIGRKLLRVEVNAA